MRFSPGRMQYSTFAYLPYVIGQGYKWWPHLQTSLFRLQTSSLIHQKQIKAVAVIIIDYSSVCILMNRMQTECNLGRFYADLQTDFHHQCCVVFQVLCGRISLDQLPQQPENAAASSPAQLVRTASSVRSLTPTFMRSGWTDAKLE